jgi:hypothetical protein
MKLIDGLYFYELVLLGLGTLLFITDLILLIIFASQKRRLRDLLLFFFISVIMIGYPSIQKIVYDNGVLTIEKLARGVSQDPSDSVQRNKLEMAILKMEPRSGKDPETLVELGKAQAALGDTVKAEKYVGKALNISPELSEAKKLQIQFNTPQVQLEKIITQVEENPSNTAAKIELENKVTEMAVNPGSNSAVMTSAAKAHILLGDTVKAMSLTESALHKDIRNEEAVALKRKFSSKYIIK